MKPRVLVIAGHDPSGGAGIQADLEALLSQGCQVATAITALTVQDNQEVYQWYPVDPAITLAQARIVLQQYPIAVIKIGLLGSRSMVTAVRQLLLEYAQIPVVLDPVLAADGGTTLAIGDITQAIRQELLPLTTLLTPNTLELQALALSVEGLDRQIQVLQQTGCRYILVTGTHDTRLDVVNRLFEHQQCIQALSWPRLPHRYHGSGCTLAASIAGFMAQGCVIPEAIRQAQHYTWHCLQAAHLQGEGPQQPNRLYWQDALS